jgi:hypothetical protein
MKTDHFTKPLRGGYNKNRPLKIKTALPDQNERKGREKYTL